jgi:DnaK suppressor protein
MSGAWENDGNVVNVANMGSEGEVANAVSEDKGANSPLLHDSTRLGGSTQGSLGLVCFRQANPFLALFFLVEYLGYHQSMDDELSASQVTELEGVLQELKLSLEGLLVTTESGSKPIKLKDNVGRLSRMAEMHNQSILLANRNMTQNRLKQVIAAIARISNHTYGYCTACEEPISFGRLKAYPEAAMCLDCKSKRE